MFLRPFLYAWLACLLVFAQQQAYSHALAHLGDGSRQEHQVGKGQPHKHACERCVVFAGMGAAAASAPPAPTFAGPGGEFAPAPLPAFFAPFRSPYLNRGPPRLA